MLLPVLRARSSFPAHQKPEIIFERDAHELRSNSVGLHFIANLIDLSPRANEIANQMEESMKVLDVVTTILLVVGGLNWGLVGAAHFDLVATVFGMHFGETSSLSAVVYLLVGLSAVYQAASFKAIQRRWAHQSALSGR